MSITLMAIGILAAIVCGSIGIASLVQAHGIHMPQCLEWIKPLSQTPHAWGAWTIAIYGTVLGPIMIAVGAKMYRVLNDPETNQAWQQLYELIVPEEDKYGYDFDDEVDKFSDDKYANLTVYRIHYKNTDNNGNAYDEYAYMIKMRDNTVIPTPCFPKADEEKNNMLTSLLGKLGFALNTDPANSQDPIPENPEN